MLQQMPDGNQFFAFSTKPWEIGLHRSIEIQPSLIDEPHDRRSGCNDFRE